MSDSQGLIRRSGAIFRYPGSTTKRPPSTRANGCYLRGLADWIGVD